MPATSNILVPLDGSDLAEAAVDIALDIAQPAGGILTLFVAAEPAAAEALYAFADSEEITRAMAADAYLDQVATRVADRGVNTVKTSTDGTNVAEEIIEQATAQDVSMIVMTSHGRSGIGRWLLGSVADKVARSATVPVVIVPCAGRG
ncbi:MAG: universal stress protein [Acidimicrobiia bacterium]|nr:universal stress protein [Acidimicrobiia bacterium]